MQTDVVMDVRKRTASVEALIQAGMKKLDKELADRQHQEAVKEDMRLTRNFNFWHSFREKLGKMIPEELMQFVNMPDQTHDPDYYPTVFLHVPGCVPVRVRAHVYGKNGEIGGFKDPRGFVVPGVRTYLPAICEDELHQGMVEIIWNSNQFACDRYVEVAEYDDVELALALASERGEYVNNRLEQIRREAAELAAELAQRPHEPVYTATDEEKHEGLVNMPEVVRLVKDLVEEALQERGI